MKIDSSNSATLAIAHTGAPRAISNDDAQNAARAAQSADAANTVNLSSMSALRTANDSDIDTAKVESIRAALRDGSYKIDSAAIADGLLSTARDLLQARTR
jgi:negative regulator of flagellin synthesis FlgM